jgi:hypothetical protein
MVEKTDRVFGKCPTVGHLFEVPCKPWHVAPDSPLNQLWGDFAFASGLLRGSISLDPAMPGASNLRITERVRLMELCGLIAEHGERLGIDTTALLRLQTRLPQRLSGEAIVDPQIAYEVWEEADILVRRIVQREGQATDPKDNTPLDSGPPDKMLAAIRGQGRDILSHLWTHRTSTIKGLEAAVWVNKSPATSEAVEKAIRRMGEKIAPFGFIVEITGGYVKLIEPARQDK